VIYFDKGIDNGDASKGLDAQTKLIKNDDKGIT
jgi:hypothetical protein